MSRRDFYLGEQEYERFRSLILERSGLHFPENRRRDLEKGLQQAFSQTDCADLSAYYRLLSQNPTSGREWERLIYQLTVGETYFFRDRFQFQALREQILPDLIAKKRTSPNRQLRIWSAGCATGEEPYSIAMLLHELLPDLSDWHITILATDINREALARAEAGLYGKWSFREQDWDHWRALYFARQDNLWQLSRQVRDMVTFSYLNLVEDPYPALINKTVAFDLVICRNVTIYFTPEITQRVVDQFYDALLEGGWLVVGHSEPSLVIYARFEPRNFPGAVLYQKTGTAPVLDLSWLEALESPQPADSPVSDLPSFPVIPSLPETTPLPAASLMGSFSDHAADWPSNGGKDGLGAGRVPLLAQEPAAAPVEPAPPAEAAVPADYALPEESDLTVADLCRQAAALLQAGCKEEALERLQRALERDRGCAQAYHLVAKIRADAGDWEEARYWCEQAIERDLLLVEGHFLMALVYHHEGELSRALASMKRVVYLDRKAVLGHFWLANLYHESGEPERSQKSLQNAAQLLESLNAEEDLPWSDGMTAGRLRYIVQQQLEGQQVLDKRGE